MAKFDWTQNCECTINITIGVSPNGPNDVSRKLSVGGILYSVICTECDTYYSRMKTNDDDTISGIAALTEYTIHEHNNDGIELESSANWTKELPKVNSNNLYKFRWI